MRLTTGLMTCTALLATGIIAGQARAAGFATYNAIVAATGVTLTSAGVMSSAKTATGIYEVTFGRPVNGCTLIGTLRGAAAGLIATTSKPGSPTVAVVTTFSASGVKTNQSFNLLAQCNS